MSEENASYGNIKCETCGMFINPIEIDNHKCVPTFPPKGYHQFTEEQIAEIRKEMDKMFCCSRCGERLNGNVRSNGYCWKCKDIINEEQKQEYLNSLKNSYIEERLSKIESWMYDHMENHPQKDWVMK